MGERYRVVPREDGGWKLIADDSIELGTIQQEVTPGQPQRDNVERQMGEGPIMPFRGAQGGTATE